MKKPGMMTSKQDYEYDNFNNLAANFLKNNKTEYKREEGYRYMANWYLDTKPDIFGIPIQANTPTWRSSSPPPEQSFAQLRQFSGTRMAKDRTLVSNYTDYNYDEKFAELVKGKRIAYVCPSPHLRGKKMGKKLDSYDLVVRVNQNYHMDEEDWEDYGRRTDILMSCLNINKLKALEETRDVREPPYEVSFMEALQYIICPQVSMWDVGRVDDFLESTGRPWHNACDGWVLKLFNEVGTVVNTGLIGVMTLLNYDIEEIYVTGMSFFNMNTFGKVYYNKYHDEALKQNRFNTTEDRHPTPDSLRMDIHHQEPQIDYFHRMIKYHYLRKLTLDDYLLENFQDSVKWVEETKK